MLDTEQFVAANRANFEALSEAADRNTPEGVGDGIALFTSAQATANNAFNTSNKAGGPTAETAEANYAAVAGSVGKAPAKRTQAEPRECDMGTLSLNLQLGLDDLLGDLRQRRSGDLGRLALISYCEVRRWARLAGYDGLLSVPIRTNRS